MTPITFYRKVAALNSEVHRNWNIAAELENMHKLPDRVPVHSVAHTIMSAQRTPIY